MRPDLVRPHDRLLAGVCAGLARHLGLAESTVRIIMIVLALCAGAGIILYAWLWLTVPTEEEQGRGAERSFDPRNVAENFAATVAPWLSTRREASAPPTPAGRPTPPPLPGTPPVPPLPTPPAGRGARSPEPARSVQSDRRDATRTIILGVILVALGGLVAAAILGLDIDLGLWLPIIAIVAGAALSWLQLDETAHQPRRGRFGIGTVRLIAGLVLVAAGVFMLVVGDLRGVDVWLVLAASVGMIAGVAVVLTPWLVKYWRELEAERGARVRASERADIAAHLHDSVLQTLALIHAKAGDETEVLRLARAQERELRAWLQRDAPAPTGSLEAALRALAAEIEDSFAVAVEVVSVGDTAIDADLAALLAATREALTNAAKHAGGPIAVYLECRPQRVELFVRDRGPGFDLDGVPADRLGVRESLIGRMARHNGLAKIRNTGNGTEVTLSVERTVAEPAAR